MLRGYLGRNRSSFTIYELYERHVYFDIWVTIYEGLILILVILAFWRVDLEDFWRTRCIFSWC